MKTFQFPYQQFRKEDLSDDVIQLINMAQDAAQKAYAPYSHFNVGAVVLLHNGEILSGANHENAAYPAGVCAERAALSALEMHDKTKAVKSIMVTYAGGGEHAKPLAPCGICRQTILEVQQWQGSPIAIYMCSPDGDVLVVENAEYLMPFSFGSEYL